MRSHALPPPRRVCPCFLFALFALSSPHVAHLLSLSLIISLDSVSFLSLRALCPLSSRRFLFSYFLTILFFSISHFSSLLCVFTVQSSSLLTYIYFLRILGS